MIPPKHKERRTITGCAPVANRDAISAIGALPLAWFGATDPSTLHISRLTLGEIVKGV